jgi:hypothetical protein
MFDSRDAAEENAQNNRQLRKGKGGGGLPFLCFDVPSAGYAGFAR